jgi:hypothetical protein
MTTPGYWIRPLIGSALLAVTIWLFGLVWSASSLASDNIMNAVEASIPDTVPQRTWREIILGTAGLVLAFSALVSTIKLRVFLMFQWWEKPLVFGATLAVIALSPLLGVPTPLFAFAVIIVCVMLRSERLGKMRSTSVKQAA